MRRNYLGVGCTKAGLRIQAQREANNSLQKHRSYRCEGKLLLGDEDCGGVQDVNISTDPILVLIEL